MIGEPEPINWAYANVIVSLDLTRPFLRGIGLDGIDPDALRDASRHAITRQTTETPSPPPRTAWRESIEAALDASARDRVTRWVQYVFETRTSDHQDWFPWHSVFSVIERSEEGFVKLGIPDDDAAPLLASYLASRSDRDLDALEDAARGAQLSTWDLQTTAVHAMVPDDPEDLLWYWIRSTWQNHRFQVFFGELVGRLDDAAMQRLFARARNVRASNHLDVERLVDPRTLQPAIPWPEGAG